ncbi:hypothetical protein SERLA73DRAFT_190126 [Serpula lacrymans var. lacrymans S7.3]|uniref:RING-type E3 ubiquitin transferase (cysteine targeting) n=2 Tax=Serpula lacrymans var. lacrymans TaxID=341189 RepID=F8QF46_SERL3|nr:uncharacterized protein SERLADRAFT_461968 [Serpula lacrymans var. lacrymans S7.9]EGN93005.1 hypothetical protein SERLA73DRAFT_190126 [Serpula lacrymans var. lacrymans S7.3]EGO27843.1 hypothetical protein SERLADRAFT_461968 [Serpula lacrymans var. lacrymans S7.9]
MSASNGATSVWQQAWDTAQPKLASIRESLSSSTSPDPRIIRVGQLDAELLDQELVHLLQEPLSKALVLVNATLKARFEPELSLLIQLTLYKLSIWSTGASYGAKLQGLKYIAPSSSNTSSQKLPRRLLLIHGTLTIIIPYLHNRLRAHALSHAWPDTPSSDRRRKAWNFLTRLESTHALCALASFVAFLWDGRYRTIADRILRLALVPSRNLVKREVSYEFMNRQMVWHAFTEFLLFLLPLVSARSLQRRLSRLSSKLALSRFLPSFSPTSLAREKPQKRGKYWTLSNDQCAICAENASFNLNLSDSANALTSLTTASPFSNTSDSSSTSQAAAEDEVPPYPIYTPYITSCGHIYCYHCIAERMIRTADEGLDDLGWECLRCAENVRGADRWEAEVSISSRDSGSEGSDDDYEFSSELGSTDISGSMGSYSGSFSE